MPRFARLHYPRSLVHIISRFVNHEFLLHGPEARADYLACLAIALARTDWTLVGYALMSSHVHLALVAGDAPVWQLLKPLNVAFAHRINRALGRLGPVFSERATTVHVPATSALRLLAYIHNNPVRAGLVSAPLGSDWTSHRAMCGHEEPPATLNAALGLWLSGCGTCPSERAAFHRLVSERMSDPRDPELSGANGLDVRSRARDGLALPVELASSIALGAGQAWPIIHLGPPADRPWSSGVEMVVQAVCSDTGVPARDLTSRDRRRETCRARRLALTVWSRLLRRDVNEMAGRLGLANSSASGLLRRSQDVRDAAERVVDRLRTAE